MVMFKILSLIPKQVWVILGSLIIGATLIMTAYDKGVEATNNKWKLKLEEQVNSQVNERLVEVNKGLEKALSFKTTKDQIIQSQTDKLNASEAKSKALQERLNEVLSNPTTHCSSLPDDEYRLYEEYFNQKL